MKDQSFNQLLLENKSFLEPFAFSLTRNTEDSRDLIQDTLYRAMVNKEKYQEDTNIRAWLYTIMRNIFINNYRRQKKFSKVSYEVPQDYYLFQQDKVAYNNGLMNFGIREIVEEINKLPDIFRITFEMYCKGFKYHEIAVALKQPLGTIKSRIHFTRKMLAYKVVRY